MPQCLELCTIQRTARDEDSRISDSGAPSIMKVYLLPVGDSFRGSFSH